MRHRHARGSRLSILVLEGRQLLSADVLTYHDDNARTSADIQETTLTPSNVNATDFGRVGFLAVDGHVDAQPLYVANVTIPGQGVHNVAYVATENDSLYAFDADNGSILWHDGPTSGNQPLLNPGETAAPAADFHCDQVAPLIGITDTPVIDASTNTVYFVTESKAITNGSPVYSQRIHAVDITTGLNKVAPTSIDSSIEVPGAGPGGNGTEVMFDPTQYVERDALTLSNGVVYTAWSSHCDAPAYTGWVIGFRADNLAVSSVLNINPNGTPSATDNAGTSGNTFWNSGGGAAVDGQGNLFNISANGPFDPSAGDYGDSYLRLSTAGGLAVSGYFTPDNQQALSDADTDLGSSGIVLLPNLTDASGNTEALAVGSGKDGNIYVVDRTSLGGFNAGSNQIVQEVTGALGGGVFSSPAYFNDTVYFGAVGATIKAFSITDARLSTTATSQSPESFGYPGASPTVSANGTTDGIVWAAENGNTAALHAFDATNLADELYNSNQAASGRDQFGAGNKFITPMVANGKVYVGTTDGVAVFGLFPKPTTPPTVAVAAFASALPTVGGIDELAAVGADSTYPTSQLTYTWSTLSTPAGVPAPTFSANGTNAASLVSVNIVQPGTYTFQVAIAAPDGQAVTSDVTINVALPAPPTVAIAAFSSPTPLVAGNDLLAAAGADSTVGEAGLTYTWSAISVPSGAPTPSFSSNGLHGSSLVSVGVARAGSYTFQVAIADGYGQAVTSDVTINVALPVPVVVVPAFSSPSPTVGALDLLAVGATDQAFRGSSLTYTWTALSRPVGAPLPTFGTNQSNASALVSVEYAQAGTYVIQVAVTNPFGQTAISDVTVVVGAKAIKKGK